MQKTLDRVDGGLELECSLRDPSDLFAVAVDIVTVRQEGGEKAKYTG